MFTLRVSDLTLTLGGGELTGEKAAESVTTI